MAARKRSTTRVERDEWRKYERIGRSLLDAAVTLAEYGEAAHGNALGVLVVHAGIAYADAVCIYAAGCKSKSGEHTEAADLLEQVVPHVPEKALKALRAILAEKDRVSYTGEFYTLAEGKRLLKRLSSFAEWAREHLGVI